MSVLKNSAWVGHVVRQTIELYRALEYHLPQSSTGLGLMTGRPPFKLFDDDELRSSKEG